MNTENEQTQGAEAASDAAANGSAQAEAADSLEALLAAANARADDNHAKLLYALADFENFKKRNERFVHDRLNAGKLATIAKFLPVLDNLQRALAYEQADGLREGLEATQRGFEALLSSENVKPLELVGTPFDPRLAEAVGTRSDGDGPENVVVEEVQRGYTLGDDVLRPARVIVSTKSQE